MKIRAGYVSNSSSSSFIIVGKELSGIKEAEEALKNGQNVYCIGKFLCDGQDVFTLTENLLNSVCQTDKIRYIASEYTQSNVENGVSINPDWKKDSEIFFFKKDCHSTSNEKSFAIRYL